MCIVKAQAPDTVEWTTEVKTKLPCMIENIFSWVTSVLCSSGDGSLMLAG
jgi:hypothetical protein